MRMNAQTSQIENGFVRLPRQAPWLESYLHELTSFPASKYKDQVDSTSQALAWISAKGREPWIIALYRMELAEMWGCTPEEAQRRMNEQRGRN